MCDWCGVFNVSNGLLYLRKLGCDEFKGGDSGVLAASRMMENDRE